MPLAPTTAPVPGDSAPTAAARRSLALDGARLLASLAIIWLHIPKSAALEASSALGRFAVPFFTQFAVLLAYEAPDRRPELTVTAYARSRFYRIYLVFIIWSVFYGLSRILTHRLLKQPTFELRLVDVFWNGTALQLWFLPFVFLATLLAFALRKLFDRSGISARAVAAGSLLLGFAAGLVAPDERFIVAAGYTVMLAVLALPSVIWAIGLGALRQTPGRRVLETMPAAVVGLGLWLAGTAWAWAGGRPTLAENLAGLGMTLLVLQPRAGAWFAWAAPLGYTAFGIYLVHPFWLEGLEAVSHRLPWATTPLMDLCIFCLAAALSIATAATLSSSRRLRWLIP